MLLTSCFGSTICSPDANRNLRGGGGGGGGVGSSGGGSFSGSGGSSQMGLPGVIAFGIVFLLAGIFSCWYLRRKCNQTNAKREAFEEYVEKAKLEVETKSRTAVSSRVSPHSGEYSTKYVDRGTTRTGSITLDFADTCTNGYTISGKGKDADGTSKIEDGHANYDGTAWWRERNVTGDVGMQVLSTGKFDFEAFSFQGEWHSSTNISGTYTSFRAKDPPANTALAPCSPQEELAIMVEGISVLRSE